MALTLTPASLFLVLVNIFSLISLSSKVIELNSDGRFGPVLQPNGRFSPVLQPIDVHDLLQWYGFPRGLLPNNVKSYTLSDDGDFEIELESPCYVELYDVYYQMIKGHLTFCSISHLSGVLVKTLFLWFPVTHVDSDKVSGFEDVPPCIKLDSI
ncbi:LOW QUALITY PROTEIN: hypothetical protein PanWU01x14_118990 [Parasponia andersonii]|uniref:Transmembrane protein n=1 Tax=Parasponia andersonii TaxID=3476 RepID=A0A2P5CVV7_PARAD|nr:LOW QUALITY PROTEIN: hypothetical protein PanWU01x14_118990 [Parasponia andersonii]